MGEPSDVTRLYDLASVIRSKNAGPFTLTLDLTFGSRGDYDRVLSSPSFTTKGIARLYNVDPSQVQVHPFERVMAVKVTLPRACSAGSSQDRDVYGCQQHFPLANLEI